MLKMARLSFPKGKQREFLVKNRLKLSEANIDIAKICNIHPRTLFDWEREKFNMNHKSAVKLARLTGISIPREANFLPEFWNCSTAGRLGAKARFKLYGNLGTYEGRSKGGKKTIHLFHKDKNLAKRSGFIVRKEIKYPARCAELAELIGIILGDGGLSGNHQLTISFNNETDREYSHYLRRLVKELFTLDCSVYYRKNNNGADIVINSSNMIDFLLKQGLSSGDKVRNQIGIPAWIFKKLEYKKACLRGLMDTDGSFYRHRYISCGKEYKYLKLCFTNCSRPILEFVFKILKELGYKVYLDDKYVSVYSKVDIKKYFKEIGTHNQKHLKKFQNYLVN